MTITWMQFNSSSFRGGIEHAPSMCVTYAGACRLKFVFFSTLSREMHSFVVNNVRLVLDVSKDKNPFHSYSVVLSSRVAYSQSTFFFVFPPQSPHRTNSFQPNIFAHQNSIVVEL